MRFLSIAVLFFGFNYLPLALANQDKTVSVIAYKVNYEQQQQVVKALAELKATQSIMLTSHVSETVTDIYFTDGEQVEKGKKLIEFNQQQELAQLKEKRVSAVEAKKQYNRLKNLKGRANISQAQIDEQYRVWQVLEAQINTLKTELNDRKITTPFSGQLGLKNFNVGDYIEQGQTLVSLDNMQTMQLDLMVSERYLPSIQVGDSIKITSNIYQDQEFTAIITAISPQLDNNSRMIMLRAELDNSQNLFKTNMLVTAHITLKSKQQLTVPNKAILMLGDHQYVYKLVADKDAKDVFGIAKVKVRMGQISANRTAITEGLRQGDIIVSQGILLVNPRKKVVIKSFENNQSQEQLLLKAQKNIK